MTSSPTWARFQGVLISCLEKLVGIYRQTMREDRGDYDWRVLVKSAALGQEIEGLWVFARLYLVVATGPAALVHRIDFEEEDAESLLNEDFEEVNDERWLDEE